MKNKVFDSAVFKFNSLCIPFKKGDSVSPKDVFFAHGICYYFERGGVIESIYIDPERPIQEPKMCVQIKSL